jgi:hypothetical protein
MIKGKGDKGKRSMTTPLKKEAHINGAILLETCCEHKLLKKQTWILKLSPKDNLKICGNNKKEYQQSLQSRNFLL